MIRMIAIVVVMLVLGYLGIHYFSDEKEAPELQQALLEAPIENPLPPRKAQQPEQFTPSVENQLPVYHLDESDVLVKSFIQQENPSLLQWLIPKELIRRFVINVNAIAKGNVPKNFPLLSFKTSPYKAMKNNTSGKLMSDPGNDSRTNALVLAITHIPPSQVIGFYQHYKPLFEEAYQELGQTGSFDAILNQALNNIINNPERPKSAELVQNSVNFQYKDKSLEKASRLDSHP